MSPTWGMRLVCLIGSVRMVTYELFRSVMLDTVTNPLLLM
jgi:hypothetical protein